jgi:two-component system alkaline phosphatase synthesis response regulator PhoP
MKRLLLVEDEPGLVLTLSDRLVREGYRVEHVGDGEAALQATEPGGFDLVILDVGLPRKNGFDVLRAMRDRGDDTPVLMLTARGQLTDRVSGLRMGADDYLTKPFEMAELLARIEARLRRDAPVTRRHDATPGTADDILVGEVRIDLGRSEVWRGDERLELSAREFQLLRYFLSHRGVSLSREQLLADVWGYHPGTTTRTVDVHVAWLRQKIEPSPKRPQFLVTVTGIGYRFGDAAPGGA